MTNIYGTISNKTLRTNLLEPWLVHLCLDGIQKCLQCSCLTLSHKVGEKRRRILIFTCFQHNIAKYELMLIFLFLTWQVNFFRYITKVYSVWFDYQTTLHSVYGVEASRKRKLFFRPHELKRIYSASFRIWNWILTFSTRVRWVTLSSVLLGLLT